MVSIWLPTFAAVVIAINTRILSGNNAAAKLLTDYFISIAASNTAHQFYFISNNETLSASSLSNVKYIAIKQQSANPLFWKLWYNYKLPAAIKKIKADVLVSADGVGSLGTKVPQFILISDIQFLHYPEWYNKRYVGFIKRNMFLFLQKAKNIVTISDTLKDELANKFAIEKNKLIVAPFNRDNKGKPLAWNDREKVKEHYTGGNEYFLFSGAIHSRNNLTTLLKAFSLFKKRQKSSMQLVMLTDTISAKNEFVESLRSYKYRNEVKLIEGLSDEETISVTAAAWCAINLSPLHSDIDFLQNALLFEVPVISGDSPQAKELLKDAALYTNPSSIDAIAEQLMMVYKNEDRRSELIENGKLLYKTKTENKLWQNIVAAIEPL